MEHVSEGANELALDLGALTNTGSHDYTQTYPLPISAAAAESTKTENDSDRLSMPMPTRSAYLSPQLLQAVAYNTELQPLPQAEKVNPMNTWIESPHQLHHAYSNDSLSAHGSSSCGSGSGSPDLYTSALPPLNQLQGPLLPQAHLERRRWRTLSGASTQSSTSTSSPRFSLTPASSREEMRAAGPDSKEDVGFSRTGQDTPHAEMAFAGPLRFHSLPSAEAHC